MNSMVRRVKTTNPKLYALICEIERERCIKELERAYTNVVPSDKAAVRPFMVDAIAGMELRKPNL